MTLTDVLFELIRTELFDDELSSHIIDSLSAEMLSKLYVLSKKHDLSQIVASALSKLELKEPGDALKHFKKQLGLSVYRYETMNYDYECICRVFEDEEIAYIPLKGSVIRRLYPEPWMRTSCDIDILVKEQDLDRAVKALVEKLSFSWNGQREYHDVSLFSESNTHLELHFNVLENMENIDRLLAKAWDFAEPEDGGKYRYKFSDEFALFHIIAHMSYHLLNGGCGIRSFVDLYLLEKNLSYDNDKLSEMCKECNIEKLRLAVENLSRVWMENHKKNSLDETLESYVISGGLYGDKEASSAIKQKKHGGRFNYMLSRVFQSSNVLKENYPILKKHNWLVPFYQIKRWYDILSTDRRKRVVTYINSSNSLSKEQIGEKIDLLKELGLY